MSAMVLGARASVRRFGSYVAYQRPGQPDILLDETAIRLACVALGIRIEREATLAPLSGRRRDDGLAPVRS